MPSKLKSIPEINALTILGCVIVGNNHCVRKKGSCVAVHYFVLTFDPPEKYHSRKNSHICAGRLSAVGYWLLASDIALGSQ